MGGALFFICTAHILTSSISEVKIYEMKLFLKRRKVKVSSEGVDGYVRVRSRHRGCVMYLYYLLTN